MSKKFSGVPKEDDTRILYRKEAKLGNYDVLHEKWNWEGIKAESIIFASDDISNLTDEEVEKEVCKSPFIKEGSSVTLKRGEEFTFVNFNFEIT
jgi:hypothetical protein